MPDDRPDSEAHNSQIIRQESELAQFPDGGSPVLAEIINRSLGHIQTSRTLAIRHQIGEHKLCGPDYQLVCSWAEELKLTKEDVLDRLLDRSQIQITDMSQIKTTAGSRTARAIRTDLSFGEFMLNGYRSSEFTTIVDGHFESLLVIRNELGITGIPIIQGLMIKKIRLYAGEYLAELDLSYVPHLTELYCGPNHLMSLNLSAVPKLKKIECNGGDLVHLDLSWVPDLMELSCRANQLTELDLSPVPKLTLLECDGNQLTALNLSAVPNLAKLMCEGNPIPELDIRGLKHLRSLNFGGIENWIHSDNIRLIKRKDQ